MIENPDPPIQPKPWPDDQCAYCRGPIVVGQYSCTGCWETLNSAVKVIAARIAKRAVFA